MLYDFAGKMKNIYDFIGNANLGEIFLEILKFVTCYRKFNIIILIAFGKSVFSIILQKFFVLSDFVWKILISEKSSGQFQ